jgi:TonB family protein
MNRFIWIALIAISLLPVAVAQGPNEGFVMESEGTQHLLQHADPTYPPIAKAAHVQGTVLLHVDVDEHGNVTKVEAIGGPPMLRTAAADTVKHWTYRPFEVNGEARLVHVIVSVPFSLGIPDATENSDQAIGQAFFPKSDECRAENAAGKWADAVRLCGEAVTIADRFPDTKERANEIRTAHESYGEALAFSGDLPTALIEFRKTVAVAKASLTPDEAEYAGAYYWQAFGEHASKMSDEADRDYATAEESYRKAIASLPDLKEEYTRELAHTLAYHAILKKQMGQDADADRLRSEALRLNPHVVDELGGKKQ